MPPKSLTCHFAECEKRAVGVSSSCGGHEAGRKSHGTKHVACIICGDTAEVASTSRAKTCSQQCKATRRAQQQALWKDQNTKRVSQVAKERYSRKRADILSYASDYREANPDLVRLNKRHYKRTREAAERSTRKVVTQRDMNRLLSRYAGHCAYCWAKTNEMHMDHVVPLSKGGYTGKGNLLPACAPCNLSKGAKWLSEWKRDMLTFTTADNG